MLPVERWYSFGLFSLFDVVPLSSKTYESSAGIADVVASDGAFFEVRRAGFAQFGHGFAPTFVAALGNTWRGHLCAFVLDGLAWFSSTTSKAKPTHQQGHPDEAIGFMTTP